MPEQTKQTAVQLVQAAPHKFEPTYATQEMPLRAEPPFVFKTSMWNPRYRLFLGPPRPFCRNAPINTGVSINNDTVKPENSAIMTSENAR